MDEGAEHKEIERVDWETNCLNMFLAQNDEVIVFHTNDFLVIGFIIGKKSDLYVVRDVEISNQLGNKRWLRSRVRSTDYNFLGSH